MYSRKFFLLRLCIFIVNLSFSLARNTVVMFGLVFPTGAQICYTINCKNSCAGLLVNVLLFVNLAYHQNVSSTNLFYSYYFGRYLSEMTELIHLPYCDWRSSCYCNKFFIFPSPFVCYKDTYVTSFFLHTAKP